MAERSSYAVYWMGDRGSPAEDVQRLLDVMSEVVAVFPDVAPWEMETDQGRVACTADEVATALDRGRLEVEDEDLGAGSVSYFYSYVFRHDASLARLVAAVRVSHEGSKEAWTPNRIVLELPGEHTAAQLERVLTLLTRVFAPVQWGVAQHGAGMAGDPASVGQPRVGIVTYLDQAYGRAETLPDGAISRILDGRGRLFRAFETLPESVEATMNAVAALRSALGAQDLLRPYAEVLREPRRLGDDEIETPRGAEPEVAEATPAPDEPPAAAERRPAPAPAATLPHPEGTITPFRKGNFVPEASELEMSPHMGATIGLTTPAMDASSMPFDAPALTLEQYASLCAELETYPQHRQQVLTRYHLDGEDAFADVEAAYRWIFEREPVKHARWAGLTMRYREHLASSAG